MTRLTVWALRPIIYLYTKLEGDEVRSLKWLRAAAFTLPLLIAACGGGGGDETTPPPSDLHPEDRVPEVQVSTVDHLFRNSRLSGENLDIDPVLQLIASATSSLDVAITRINRQDAVLALLSEAASGVQVRIVTEKAYYDDPEYRPFYDQLEDPTKNGGNLQIRTDAEGLPRVMHNRFMVIDQARVVTGSFNWEASSHGETFGDVINILHTGIAAAFSNQFNQMFNEGLFGVNKRDDSNHVFRVGGGVGRVEVFFGPTDRPRDLLAGEITASRSSFFAVQQFTDPALLNFFGGMLGAGGSLVGMFNNFGDLGGDDENAVYLALANYAVAPTGGPAVVNGFWDDGNGDGVVDRGESTHWLPRASLGGEDQYSTYNTMNHKLIFCDRAAGDFVDEFGRSPSVTCTSANFTDLGLSLNDETFIIFRGTNLANKFVRGVNFNSNIPPAALTEADDVQEIDQLQLMYPYTSAATTFRNFQIAPTSLVFGTVPNFEQEVDVATGDTTDGGSGNIVVPVELFFYFYGTTYFGQTVGDENNPIPLFSDTFDSFEESAVANPDKEFMFVMPAGDFTIVVETVAASGGGTSTVPFETTKRQIETGPGAARSVTLRMGRPQTDLTGGGSGGSGGGGGA